MYSYHSPFNLRRGPGKPCLPCVMWFFFTYQNIAYIFEQSLELNLISAKLVQDFVHCKIATQSNKEL